MTKQHKKLHFKGRSACFARQWRLSVTQRTPLYPSVPLLNFHASLRRRSPRTILADEPWMPRGPHSPMRRCAMPCGADAALPSEPRLPRGSHRWEPCRAEPRGSAASRACFGGSVFHRVIKGFMLQARPEAAAPHSAALPPPERRQPGTTALGRATTALGRSAGRRLHKGERHRRRVHLRHAAAALRCSRVCDAGGRKWYTRVLTAGGRAGGRAGRGGTRVLTAGGRGRLGGDSVIGA
jgi:hypothetical protein